MAEFGIMIVDKLTEVIGSEIIKEICDLWGYKSQLQDLHKTISTIKNVLLDAEAKRELSNEQQGYIRELKTVVYDADDLFDEFLTLAELNQIDGKASKVGKFITYKVNRFFSSNRKKLGQAYKMSRKVKDIKKQLDFIAYNHTEFGLSVDYKPICRRREETCAYVDSKDIIGRDEDKEKIINRLLDPEAKDDFRLVTIVGVGGVGKTSLAQLVYNDDRIKEEFESLRLWVCVSDQDGEQFDVKVILCKILESDKGIRFDVCCTMELVKKQFEERLRGKKYLLVLDDIWNEDRKKWLDLKQFLKCGHKGSRILVTTRSMISASIMGDKHAHALKSLSKEDSWHLFEMSAFDKGLEDENQHEMDKIGRLIVEKCHCIPLAVKVVGSLLFGQSINKWRLFAASELAEINTIMSTLKLSYHNLEPSLKSCFSYCALFPKDIRFKKDELISLWMAQGYIMPLYGDKTIEDVAEEYFLLLLRRCFFQDAIKNEYGEVISVKIHDLMHDVAKDAGKDEISVVYCGHKDQLVRLGENIRHLCYVGDNFQNNCLHLSKIRSFIHWNSVEKPFVDIGKWVFLRVLYLDNCPNEHFHKSIGKLHLLRFLDLSFNDDLEVLPDSITKLHNLQTLILYDCANLRELPKELCKLVKLRHLDLENCNFLTHMPFMGKLTNLTVLPLFVAGCQTTIDKQSDGELKSLQTLTKIKGDIKILVHESFDHSVEKMINIGEGYLSELEHLKGVTIKFDSLGKCDNHEIVLGNMGPHLNIKSLTLDYYQGTTIPRWGRAEDNWAISLPHLVHIHLQDCRELHKIPALSKLRHLRSLKFCNLENLEYIEERSSSSSNNCSRGDTEATLFFPSLESLEIFCLKKLKGWWKVEGLMVDDHHFSASQIKFQFHRLTKLKISICRNLMSFPPCLNLETLEVWGNNKSLQIMVETTNDVIKLRDFRAENVGYLKSLPSGFISGLVIEGDEEVERLSKFGEEVFETHGSYLRRLLIHECKNLRRLNEIRGWKHITVLEELELLHDKQLGIEEDDDEPWKFFHNSLCSLSFMILPSMTRLPKGMHYLTSLKELRLDHCENVKALPELISSLSSLQSLYIWGCPALKSLPQEIQNVTSLHTLDIRGCPELMERCKEPNGEDLPKIRNIAKRSFG